MEVNQFNNKKILITGASRGIGAAIAKRLAGKGYDVYVNYAGNEEKAAKTKAEIEASGGKCTLIKADLKSADCADKIAEIVNSVDILILNASIQYRRNWNEITMEDFDDQVNCNFRSSLLLIQKFAPQMIKKKWGRIITIGSVQERKPHPEMLIYSSMKAAQTIMAQSLALQFAETGVTVNSVAPGVINTDRNDDVLSNPEKTKAALAKIPMNKWGEADDCAGIIEFICSEESRYMTGQNIFIDGGMGIK